MSADGGVEPCRAHSRSESHRLRHVTCSHMQLWRPLEAERLNSKEHKSATSVLTSFLLLLGLNNLHSQKANSLQLYPNSSSSSSVSVDLPGISVSVSVSVSPTWGTTGRRRPALLGKALAASRFAACRARVWEQSG